MPRGRQYYDPIIQKPQGVKGAPVRRIELYPEHDVRDNVPNPRWVARLIGEDGLIVEHSPGSIDHDDALQQAQALWPGLEVFELREESEDSTHEGMGPSPRLWQVPPAAQPPPTPLPERLAESVAGLAEAAPDDAVKGARVLKVLVAEMPGAYLHINDVMLLLEEYAQQYDEQGNPSGALALREAAAALREPF